MVVCWKGILWVLKRPKIAKRKRAGSTCVDLLMSVCWWIAVVMCKCVSILTSSASQHTGELFLPSLSIIPALSLLILINSSTYLIDVIWIGSWLWSSVQIMWEMNPKAQVTFQPSRAPRSSPNQGVVQFLLWFSWYKRFLAPIETLGNVVRTWAFL